MRSEPKIHDASKSCPNARYGLLLRGVDDQGALLDELERLFKYRRHRR